jgi:hypothetical protein
MSSGDDFPLETAVLAPRTAALDAAQIGVGRVVCLGADRRQHNRRGRCVARDGVRVR